MDHRLLNYVTQPREWSRARHALTRIGIQTLYDCFAIFVTVFVVVGIPVISLVGTAFFYFVWTLLTAPKELPNPLLYVFHIFAALVIIVGVGGFACWFIFLLNMIMDGIVFRLHAPRWFAPILFFLLVASLFLPVHFLNHEPVFDWLGNVGIAAGLTTAAFCIYWIPFVLSDRITYWLGKKFGVTKNKSH